MDWSNYITARIPTMIRGITGLAAAKMVHSVEPVDVSEKYIAQRLKILENYENTLKERHEMEQRANQVAEIPAKRIKTADPEPTSHLVDCPYCRLEEIAGIVRNHLLFVAQECKGDKLGTATGGMIPKAKEHVEDFIRRVDELDGAPYATIIAQLAKQTAEMLLPKLEWINNCEEAQDAATLADELWHRAAKTTQLFYAKGNATPGA